MSKAGSHSSSSTLIRGGRNAWVRSVSPPFAAEEKAAATKKSSGKRFVEPYRLSDEQRDRLLTTLEESDIGDAQSRDLFVAALEYDLGGCPSLTQPTDSSKKAQAPAVSNRMGETLCEIGRAAQLLADGLAGLDAETSRTLQEALAETDRFKRSYSGNYLAAMERALSRIATVSQTSECQATQAPDAPPALSDDAHRFVLRAADAFRECFERTPTTEKGAPFVNAIASIASVIGVRIPTDPETLSEILRQA